MKEIKSYISHDVLGKAIEELASRGFDRLTVSDALIVDPASYSKSGTQSGFLPDIARLEVVCEDERVTAAVEILQRVIKSVGPKLLTILVTTVDLIPL